MNETGMKPGQAMLIADSGSTKTDWALVGAGAVVRLSTQGINPYQLSPEQIGGLLREELCPRLNGTEVGSVCFYGAGCRGQAVQEMTAEFTGLFPGSKVFVGSDLLGAARALCGTRAGVACILGTGANSCLYDGTSVVQNVSPLGYVLGDEGSGAVLGRRLVGDVLKGQLSRHLCDAFYRETGLTLDVVLERVYRAPFPNRFLASLAPFLHAHCEEDEIHYILMEEFRRFFRRNVTQYRRPELPVHFVGSIAWHFSAELAKSAEAEGFVLGRIEKSPLDGLIDYHRPI